MRYGLILAAFALIAAAAPTQRFDLDCSGTVTSDDGPDTAYAAHYRIDLVARKWCQDECRTRVAIADLQPAMIVLEKSSERPNPRFVHSIDRETGEDHIFSRGETLSSTTGQCRKLPFSGFPTFATKL